MPNTVNDTSKYRQSWKVSNWSEHRPGGYMVGVKMPKFKTWTKEEEEKALNVFYTSNQLFGDDGLWF